MQRSEEPLKANSILEIYGSSPFLRSSSSCSSLRLDTGGESRSIITGSTQHVIRKKSRVTNYLQHRPQSLQDDQGLLELDKSCGTDYHPCKRSSKPHSYVLANPSFHCFDRFLGSRIDTDVKSSPIRTTQPPEQLTRREQYHRQYDHVTDPFRNSDRSKKDCAVKISTGRTHFAQTPHFVPSFVSGFTASPSHINAHPTHLPALNDGHNVAWNQVTNPYPRLMLGTAGYDARQFTSGTVASILHKNFFGTENEDEKIKCHRKRLAAALDIDQARRIMTLMRKKVSSPCLSSRYMETVWKDSAWIRRDHSPVVPQPRFKILECPTKSVPQVAFRVLDAPRLKDDYYCSVLAFSNVHRTLAVALTHRVYLWTENHGVRYPPIPSTRPNNYVTSLAFSSDDGRRGILALSRNGGTVTMWSLFDQSPRLSLEHSAATCCVAFRPKISRRISKLHGYETEHEDLLVGDDQGSIYYYSVEWSTNFPVNATLLIKLKAHEQNICGLAWSTNGQSFVSGGNDNHASFFLVKDVLQDLDKTSILTETSQTGGALSSISASNSQASSITSKDTSIEERMSAEASQNTDASDLPSRLWPTRLPPTPPRSPLNRQGRFPYESTTGEAPGIPNLQKYRFLHSAAVKAIAFAPWQPTLLATGGGSNDRQIHFHHTASGTTLAVIHVFAQVTSLVWSRTKREIAATFGYAQPEHEIRIAVFSWPECECVVTIPWETKEGGGVGRALWAISYPGGPNDAMPGRKTGTNNNSVSWELTQVLGLEVNTPARQQPTLPPTPETSPQRPNFQAHHQVNLHAVDREARYQSRSEGETWASRTEEEGSLIIACCDQTVKFFEVWAGKSKGKGIALGSKPGVLGGSKVLEGWCENTGIEEVGRGEQTIR